MQRNLILDTTRSEVYARIEKLSENSKPSWGKMNVGQMLAHVAEQVRICDGIKPARLRGSAAKRWLLRTIAMQISGMPRNVKTIKELDAFRDTMTSPTDFANDKGILLKMLSDFGNYHANQTFTHPVFGEMNTHQFGRLTYVHLDHHLKQFGV